MRFIIPGNPQAQGRPRFARIGKFVRTYDPAESVSFKNKVALFARDSGAQLFETDRPLTLKVKFFLKRPKNKMRRKDSINAIGCAKKPDLDNLVKAILDGLNGIIYRDDGQVQKCEAEKYYHEIGGAPRTEIEIF